MQPLRRFAPPPRIRGGRISGNGVIAVLIVAECLFLLLVVALGWTFRSLMLNPGDAEFHIRSRTVGADAAWLGLNVAGGLAYAFRRDGLGRYAILAVLAIDVINALFTAVVFFSNSDAGDAILWLVEGLIPAAALTLIWLTTGADLSQRA